MAAQKILIVDDSRTIRMQVRDMLPKGNFEVLEARDGIEGLSVISQELPNLVLLDFFMPRMNGWEVVQQIQDDPKLKAIPIVMMSGRREDVEQAVPELFNYFEFVSKPFEQARLFQAIKSATAKAKERREGVAGPVTGASPASTTVATAAPDLARAGADTGDTLQLLKTQMQQLQAQNAKLQAEVETLKKQLNQVVAFVRQKLK